MDFKSKRFKISKITIYCYTVKYHFCTFIEKQTRVDIYLSTLFKDFSRSYIQKIIDKWYVKVNSKEIKKNIKLNNKDELEINISLEKSFIKAEKIDLDIVYEDKNLIIVNKDAWIVTHPTPWESWKVWTLVNALLYHTKDLAWIWGIERPWIVHRLDKDTSWLILVAKNDKMMKYLQEIIKKREIEKYYIAIVYWIIKDREFKIESYIGRHQTDKTKMTTKNPINPKLAVSYGKVIDYIWEKYTLLEIKLETWRTHQIRVHLSSIWYPIIWDKVYWKQEINEEVFKKYKLSRQALHSYKLKFVLYWKNFEIIWSLKENMKKIIWNKM